MLGRQAAAALRLLLVLTVLLGGIYPLGIWAVSRLPGLHGPAEGSLISAPGAAPRGSSLIGIDQVPANPAADPWFHTRPSASSTADDGLGPADPSTSGGSNKSADSADLVTAIDARRAAIAARESVSPPAVPADAVTASGSGLDPHISPPYAALQVPRVARVTGLPVERVRDLVAGATDGRSLGVFGEPGVNVPDLDAALAAAAPGIR
ncbi:potassium-transporting ATPase subunit C [Actinomycetospora sp.]|uniref:potassium-transporting ATPase subunit C n=1 Tax=Actinomycetospora sp. TaxID=1872135 RepID=UPI002F3FC5DB